MKKNNLERCLWFDMAISGLSTTFEDVKEHNTNHPLYSCKYNCDGMKYGCNGYKSNKKTHKNLK